MVEDLSKRLYVENVEEWQNELLKRRFFDRTPEVKIIERGIILPARSIGGTWKGGVCDGDFNFIAGFTREDPISRRTWRRWAFTWVNSAYTVNRKEVFQLNEDVIFGGALMGHFGHFTLECWSRLWFVISHPELPLKILFITTTHGGYHNWFDDFFRLMGIDLSRIIYVDKPVQCRSIIVPEQAAYVPVSFTKEFLLPYQAIRSKVKPANHKKLYLTRTQFESADSVGVHCYNEKYFEDFFVAHGFEAVSMEKLSVAEQISLIAGADEIAATLGTLTHWVMFCKPTAKFIMLNRIRTGVIDFQCFIHEAFNFANYYIVDASKNFLFTDRTNGEVLLGSNKYWKAFVKDYFNEQIEEDDDTLYFDDALDKYINSWCKRYYATRLIDSLKDLCNRVIALEKEVANKRPLINYQTHIAQKGWSKWKRENQISNVLDELLDIQAIKINFPSHKIYYAVYYNDKEGWSAEVSNGKQAGTTGRSKSITGIKIRLDEADAKEFNVLYRAHKFDGSWTAWAKNGAELFSDAQKLNAVQIKLESKS